MFYYHGTWKSGLTELIPTNSPTSSLKEPCVYLSTCRLVALFYIWDYQKLPIRTLMMSIRGDSVVFQEMLSGGLELFYKGTSGYIYRCEGEYEMCEDHGVKTCAISREPVPVKDAEYIADVYEEIMKYQIQGKFFYEKYEQRSQQCHDIIRGYVMREMKSEDILHRPEHPYHLLFQEKYPQYWKEAVVLEKNGLL